MDPVTKRGFDSLVEGLLELARFPWLDLHKARPGQVSRALGLRDPTSLVTGDFLKAGVAISKDS